MFGYRCAANAGFAEFHWLQLERSLSEAARERTAHTRAAPHFTLASLPGACIHPPPTMPQKTQSGCPLTPPTFFPNRSSIFWLQQLPWRTIGGRTTFACPARLHADDDRAVTVQRGMVGYAAAALRADARGLFSRADMVECVPPMET
jgi:hypothetical protein